MLGLLLSLWGALNVIARASRAQWAVAACTGISVVNLPHIAQPALADWFRLMSARANIGILRGVVAKLILTEETACHRGSTLWLWHMGHEPRLLAGREVLGPKITQARGWPS
jgi:hypothetical protein